MTAAPPLPSFAQFEPVGQCNLRCQMCPIQFREEGPPFGPPAFMDFALYQRLVDEFPRLEGVHLQGLGEPLMHPRFTEMVSYAAARGAAVTTNSNMTLMNPRKAAALIGCGLRTLHVSIDGATAATYEDIRRRGHLERVLANVRMVLGARRAAGAEFPRLHLVAVAMRRNLAELPALADLAAELECDELFVQHLAHDFGEEALPGRYRPMRDFVERETLLREDPERVAAVFEDVRERAGRHGLALRLPPLAVRTYPPGTPGPERCSWPWNSAYFSWDGRMMPCCMVATPDRMNFGSAAERGVTEVWTSSAYAGFRAALASDSPPAICASCALYNGTF
ncbi:MAG: radical SAM/SPASM domain-containing protein [Hyphomicrobiales bacterium]